MKTWGLFSKDGSPVAAGDDWYKWECPQQEYQLVDDFDFMDIPVGHHFEKVPCPFKPVAVKLDRCEKCGMEFRYP